MTTKDHCLSFNNKKRETFGINATSNSQYSNLNLNQNNLKNTVSSSKCIVTNEIRKSAVTESLDTNDSQKNFRDKHLKDLPSNFWEQTHQRRKENHRKEFNYREKNQTKKTNSTLSLHITAYENSIENISGDFRHGDDNSLSKKTKEEKGLIKKWKNATDLFSDSAIKVVFEFPRQQEGDKVVDPEVMQFKTSQRLLNPNQVRSSAFGGTGTITSYGPKKDSKSLRSTTSSSKTKISPSKIPGLTARANNGVRRSSTKILRNNTSKIPGLTRNALNPGISRRRDREDEDDTYDSTPVAPLNIPIKLGLIKENFAKLQEKKVPPTPLPEETSEESKQSVAAQLKKLLNRVCERPEDKYLLLKRRDDLLSKARVHNFDINASNVILGTLKEMCPEKERYSRLMQGTESFYECDAGEFNPEKAVKEYSRSAADQELPLPHEMRPIDTLELTMNFLMSEIADDNVTNASELLRWFDFLWNRTRAIRKDITQQQLVSERVVGLIEKCARFHIFAGYRLAPLSPQFDQRLNIENLNKCLLSLRHCYDDLARKNILCQNEAEFRSYDILLNLCDSNVFNQSCQYRQEIQNDKMVQNALEIALSFHTDNISRFFKLVEAPETSFLQACLCYNHFQAFRAQLLMQASKAFKSENILSYLTPFFFFENEKDCLDFLTYHGCTVLESRPERTTVSISMATLKSELKDFPDPIIARKLKSAVSEVIYKGIPPKVKPPKATNSFDSRDRYVHDPVLTQFLQEIGEETEETVEDNKKIPPVSFSFGQSNDIPGTTGFLNKKLFKSGYSSDPKETFPVTIFAPSTTTKPPFSFGPSTNGISPFNSTFKTNGDTSTLAPPSLPTLPNASFPPKTTTASSSLNTFQPTTLPAFVPPPKPIEPAQPPPGPTKEEIEAENRKHAEEERKRKEAEKAKLNQLAETLAKSLVEDILQKTVKKLVVHGSGLAQRKAKENTKERKKLVRITTKSLYSDLIHDTLMKFVEKAYDQIYQRWLRLEAIRIIVSDIRLKERCRRYVKIWRWATKKKRQDRAIENFPKALANRSDDAIRGISKIIKPVFGNRIRKCDLDRLDEIKKRRIQAEYFGIWKNAVAARRKLKEERRKAFSITNQVEMPKLLQLREEQNQRLMHGSNLLFPNRKRLSEIEPECTSAKQRFFTSTPYRGGEPSAFMLDVSPVIRTISPDSIQDAQENVSTTLTELNNRFEKMSTILEQTKQNNMDIQSRYKHLFTDVKK